MNLAAIIAMLRKNARQKYSEMSKALSISLASAWNQHKRAEQMYIKGYSTLLDFKRLGYPLHYFFMVKSTIPLSHPCVNSVYTLQESRFLVEAFFKDYHQFHDFAAEYEKWICKEIPILEVIAVEQFLGN